MTDVGMCLAQGSERMPKTLRAGYHEVSVHRLLMDVYSASYNFQLYQQYAVERWSGKT